MANWITDRPPTEADVDEHGHVLAQLPSVFKPGDTWNCFAKWKYVTTGTPWRRTSLWRSPTTNIPRKFTSITRTGDSYLALADDGTAWEDYGIGWEQLPPLPARELEGSND